MTQSARGDGQAKPPLKIRALQAGDRLAWDRLWTGYLTFYETSLPAEIYDLTFRRYLDPDMPGMFAFVAERDGDLLGLVHCICHPHGWKPTDVVYLQDLFTAPEARGQGVALALIEAVYAEADARGMSGTYWLTQTHNHTARALYDRVAEVTPFIKYQRF